MPTRVLVIEDDRDIQDLATLMLTDAGFVVTAVGSGEEGLAAIQAAQPDVVVLDIKLPGIDGWEVARQLTALGVMPAMPVLVLSAHVGEASEQMARDTGCRSYLSKPFSKAQLVEAVRNALR